MDRYALIDVSNTKGTTSLLLGFSIAWDKLIALLKGPRWDCKEVIYYEGTMENQKYEKRHRKLERLGYVVRSKLIFMQQGKQKSLRFICMGCKTENNTDLTKARFVCDTCTIDNSVRSNQNRNPKANFDVEITVDALSYAGPNTEIILFTGDGDFRYLAEKLLEKGSLVTFVSSRKQTSSVRRRFSTRLKDLVAEHELESQKKDVTPRVRILEIDNWKRLIER